ncbi:translocation/assembly module TamB domain-containing protein [Alysiella crassa]|uniref:Family of uncharacterized function (DUF490) n=1 Tax=Alysiella crassa TaxID=153491 RepID=A0A376BL39_9NEIS|nr:translocation/assembly module TamB domain-containing protein [Alysiella crassa]UOP07395.1 translocation/assembly module TamB domain-containing protein [Alysiella crassa]SSY70421.1 Family of uncharacterised function (DUF490) [Alysiella crassa]
MTDQATTLPDNTPNTPPQPPRRTRHWLRRMVSFLVLLLTVVVGAVVAAAIWLFGSEDGLRYAIRLPEKLPIGVNVQAKSVNGTIWHGFSANEISVDMESAHIQASHLHFKWQPQDLLKEHLHINQLHIGDVHIDNKPTPPKPKAEPPKLPESISLPLTASLDSLQVGKITQGKQKTVLLHRVQAAYRYDHKHHILNIQSLKTDWSDSQGSLQLNTVLPYAVLGKLTSQGELDGIAVDNLLQLSGSLKDIALKTNIKGLGISLDGDTSFHPFAPNIRDYIGHIQLKGEGINPRAFLQSLPQAKLTFQANVLPELGDVIGLTGKINLQNHQPLTADKNGIPVRQLSGDFRVNESGAVEIARLQANLMERGEVNVSGGIYAQKKTLNLQAAIKNLTSADIVNTHFHGTFNGKLMATGSFVRPKVAFDVNTGRADVQGALSLISDEQNGQRTLLLENGTIRPQNGGVANVAARFELFKNQNVMANVNSQSLDLSKLYPDLPSSNINGDIKLQGEVARNAYHAELHFRPSHFSGANLSGNGYVSYENNHLSKANLSVKLGNNIVQTQGSFGRKNDVLKVNVNAPSLAQLGFGIKGLANISGSLKNTEDSWTKIEADLAGQAREFTIPNVVVIKTLDFKAKGSPEFTAPLVLAVDGKGIVSGGTAIDNVQLALNGSVRDHVLQGAGSLKLDGKPFVLKLAAKGGLSEQNQWIGTVNTLDLAGALDLRLQNTLNLEAGAERVVLSAARWQALGGSLNLQQFVWDKKNGLTTKGRAENVHLVQLHNFYTPPIEHDLVVASEWDLSYSNAPRGYLNLRQLGGDMILPTARKPKLELNNFVLQTRLAEKGILNQFSGDTRYGKASGDFNILRGFGDGDLLAAPVGGTLRLDVAELNNLKNILPTGQTVRGRIAAAAAVSGVLSAPKLVGTINGENLYYRNQSAGIVLKDGSLKSRLQDRVWTVDSLQFRRGGTATLTGTADYSGSLPIVNAEVVFDKYQALNQATRDLTISGKTQLFYNEQGFTLNGKLITDEGKFGFQESSAPTLDDDVVVLGETQPEKSASTPFNMNLVFDLNDKFQFSGEGLRVLLGGQLTLTTRPQQDVTGVGSIHVVRGRYKAYGQDLVISKGLISFVGPLSQPNLNIRAERRGSPVGAGVEVLGNLNSPRITLVANEPMSEKDKLSWLILNRPSSGSSTDNAALATAASAFLAGSLNDKVGLVDDFGLSSSQTRNAQTGEMNPAQQVITFGKQLNRDLYFGYEAGLQTASQSAKLVYQLSKSFQAIARLGTESSGVEVKYIKRFDGDDFDWFGRDKSFHKPKNQAE